MHQITEQSETAQPPEAARPPARREALPLAGLVMAVGTMVLLGWRFDVEILKRIVPALVAMNPATAIAFISAAISLTLLTCSSGRQGRRLHSAAAIFALSAAAIGALKTASFFGLPWLDFGIDRLLFRAKLDSEAVINRMAPNTAACFVLIGLALLAMCGAARFRFAVAVGQSLALGCGLLAMLALIGYAYSASALYGVGQFIPMALNTALCFMLLSIGVLAIKPAEGMMGPFTSRTAGGILARRMIPAVIVIPPLIGWLRLTGEQAGWYGLSAGVSMMAVATTLLFLILLWFTARELRRHAEEIEDLYNNAPCGYHSLDVNGAFVRINDTELNWLGYQRGEVVGRMSFAQMLAPESLETFKKSFPAFKERGEVRDLEFDLIRKDGTTLPVLLSASAIRDGAGNFIASRSTMIDLTHRRRMMDDLRRARADAEHANQAKSEFLANMSHEIRTPMMAIIGYADLLLDHTLTPSDRLNNVNVIRRNSDHLLAIINDILDLSKIEAGEMKAESIECSPCKVIYDVVSLMRARATDKGLRFTVELAGVIPETIQTDPTRLRQILINLIGNAVKFTETGEVKLRVRLEQVPSAEYRVPRAVCDDSVLRFDVIDTGIGISEAQMQELFKPFAQADGSMTRRFGGTGLGLTISQRLATMLGGAIDVQSSPGRGSTFTLSVATGSLEGVRLLKDCREAMLEPQEHEVPPVRAHSRLRGRILLAEDGYDNRQLIVHYLREAGAEVVAAENGRIACDLALAAMKRREPFDLIVMDMQMPELDGYGATSKLRSNGCEAPILALTAHAMAKDREKCLSVGCTDYLSKPVRREALLTVLARYIGAETDDSQSTSADAPDRSIHSELLDESILPFVDAFVRSMKGRVAEIERAVEQGDAEALSELLHQIKGSAGLFGFMPITELAEKLEDRVQRGRPLESIACEARELAEMMRRAAAPRLSAAA